MIVPQPLHLWFSDITAEIFQQQVSLLFENGNSSYLEIADDEKNFQPTIHAFFCVTHGVPIPPVE